MALLIADFVFPRCPRAWPAASPPRTQTSSDCAPRRILYSRHAMIDDEML
jgi:hypothetical protein